MNTNTRSLIKNPFFIFLPFLAVYSIWIIINPPNGISGDEPRYLQGAMNMIQGYYSSPSDVEFINGPGYPIFLLPFVFFGLPLIVITLMNAVLHYLSAVVLFNALIKIVQWRTALIFSLGWAAYYLAYQSLVFIHTETLTYFLISLLIYSATVAFLSDNRRKQLMYLLLTGIIFGYIVLTKIIFGYVLVLLMAGTIIYWLIDFRNNHIRKTLFILLVSFLTTSPYLIYTYRLTGQVLYWGSGGDSFYWMTTPYENEYGSWFPEEDKWFVPSFYDTYVSGTKDTIESVHKEDLAEVAKYKGVDKDRAYQRLAIRNIKETPLKYLQNIVYNFGRLVFQYPFSYGVHRPKLLLVFPANGILLGLILFCLIPTFLNWRKILYPIKFLIFITLIYLGGSTLVTAYVRMFTIIVPILIFWMAYICQHCVTINLKFSLKASNAK